MTSTEIQQFATMTGLTAEELAAEVAAVVATTPMFDESTRRIETIIRSMPFSEDMPADYRLAGVNNGLAYFLRASRTEAENESAALQMAASRLMQRQERQVYTPVDPDITPYADLMAALDEEEAENDSE